MAPVINYSHSSLTDYKAFYDHDGRGEQSERVQVDPELKNLHEQLCLQFGTYKYIRSFFEVPLCQIRKCEKQLNPMSSKNQPNYFPVTQHLGYQKQLTNFIEIAAKDGQRRFKVFFDLKQSY
mmetsp:Transcript_10505/g.17610  ORF Transcript_10505/g.17610 Transcript_10505/m.17610 type:complete len:122 (+) Transcript_10505:362-727(+)